MDKRVGQTTVHGVAKSQSWLSDTHIFVHTLKAPVNKCWKELVYCTRLVFLSVDDMLTYWPEPQTMVVHYSSLLSLSSVQFSCSVVSDSLWPHGLQQARLPCPSPTPGACSNSCPSSQWCLPTISSSVVPFSPRIQSFPASGSLQMSQLYVSGSQSIGASASESVLPMNIQDWFPLWLQSPCSPRDSQESSSMLFINIHV